MGGEFQCYQMKKALEIGVSPSHNGANVFNAAELYAKKWLRW